jgi:hypothetical protein
MKTNPTETENLSIDDKPSTETTSPRSRRGSKRRSPETSTAKGPVRFFLSKTESNGTPLLDEEFDSEGEAMIESLKTGRNYFVISEWKSAADLSKKVPQIRKECVTAKRVN